jgi:hypothetical protein
MHVVDAQSASGSYQLFLHADESPDRRRIPGYRFDS